MRTVTVLLQELDLALQPADLILQCDIFHDDLKQFFGQLTRHVCLRLYWGLIRHVLSFFFGL